MKTELILAEISARHKDAPEKDWRDIAIGVLIENQAHMSEQISLLKKDTQTWNAWKPLGGTS